MGLRLQGKTASDGLFMGPARVIRASRRARVSAGDAEKEGAALTQAVAQAVAELSALMGRVEGEAQEMLGFQVAMLEDDALSAPARAAIGKGMAADAAWAAALEDEVAGYEASEDDYFRARAADLKDMRDRVLRHLSGEAEQDARGGMVLVGDDIAPTLFLETDWSAGGAIALREGSATSHVAMLARARGVPMVVGLGAFDAAAGAEVIVDGGAGSIVIAPDEAERARFAEAQGDDTARRAAEDRFRFSPGATRDGRRIEVLVNVAGPEELDHLDVRCCDGIGLMRSEFLFRDGAPLPDEEQQYRAYRRCLEWAQRRPVTIRTLDIGGDKPISGLTPAGESNPFLGLRGVRLTLARPEVFRTQLRALARAAVHGTLKVMIPMVTVPEEIDRTAALLDEAVAGLAAENVPCKRPPLGIMVEVPAVAIAPDLYTEAAFFSIGSNDLTQYVTASSRDDARVAALNDPANPAVLRLVGQVARFGREAKIPVSLCGDMASEPKHLKALIEAGLTSLSVAPARVARVKAALAEV